MDYFRGYRTFRDDPAWTSKMFVGVALALCAAIIPIVPTVALQGWAALVLRRSVHGIDAPMPRLDFDFDYLGKLLNPGFKAFIVRMIWTLPVSFLAAGMFLCLYFGGVMAVIGGAKGGGEGGAFAAMCCVGAAVLMLVPVFITLTLPATIASLRAELMDDLNEGLKFGEIFAMTKLVFKELFLGSLIIGMTQFALAMVGLLLCYLPAFGVMWLGTYVNAMFQAELYRLYLAKGGTPFAKLASPELVPAQAAPAPQQPGGW
jgi:hypothetical protein